MGAARGRRSARLATGAAALAALLVLWLLRPAAVPERPIDARPPHPPAAGPSPPARLEFRDVTAEAGIRFSRVNGAYGNKLLPEAFGGGAAFLDYDGDGAPDLLLVNGSHWPNARVGPPPRQALYRNDGTGRFRDVTAEADLPAGVYGIGAAAGDYDGDGDPDLYLTAVGANRLLRNDGGRFTDVTAEAGVGGAPDVMSTCATFFDADGDGRLDLFVCNYLRWRVRVDTILDHRLEGYRRSYGPPRHYPGAHPSLYRNLGDGRFADVSAEAGVEVAHPDTGQPMVKALGVVPADVDCDGRLDLVVTSDGVRTLVLRSLGDGRFEEVGEALGLAYDRRGRSFRASGVDAAYYRNDAELGVAVGSPEYGVGGLFVGGLAGDALFEDAAASAGLAAPSALYSGFGMLWLDADLDGWLDLLQANGHIEDDIAVLAARKDYAQPPLLFRNGGAQRAGVFTALDPADLGDLGAPMVARAAAYADIDADGDLDLLLTQPAGPPRLLRNDQATGHRWLRITLEGVPARGVTRDAVGAEVEVVAGGRTHRRRVAPTRGYLAQVERALTFGLGNAERADAIVIRWPDGSIQELPGLALDQHHHVVQDDAAPASRAGVPRARSG